MGLQMQPRQQPLIRSQDRPKTPKSTLGLK